MSAHAPDYLYRLLPALYRLRDPSTAADGGPQPLRTLLAAVQQVLDSLETDVDRLGDDWFIETCQPWLIPYIGDLLRVRALHATTTTTANQRAFVANTMVYRRRKGTVAMLEELAHDVTGWPAVAVEFFSRLETTQNINHLRLGNVRTPDLRDTNGLELLGTPFSAVAHTAELRRVEVGRGRYNIPNVGLYLFRLAACRVIAAPPGAPSAPDAFLTFDPLGRDLPLFNPTRTERAFESLARESELPVSLRRRALFDDLNGYRSSPADDRRTSYFLSGDPVFAIRLDGIEVPPERIQICNLAESFAPPLPGFDVRVDPELGRLMLAPGVDPATARVSYYYGSVGDVGGGDYDRSLRLSASAGRQVAQISGGAAALEVALASWAAGGQPDAVIEITDNERYSLPVSLAVRGNLEVRSLNRCRPSLVVSSAASTFAITLASGTLTFSGLLISGAALTVTVQHEGSLTVSDSTLALRAATGSVVPAGIAAGGAGSAGFLHLRVTRSVTGPIQLSRLSAGSMLEADVTLGESIVDAGSDASLAVEATLATFERTTVLGCTALTTLERASECLFTGLVEADRTQEGCLRFSFVSIESRTPPRYRCQPEAAIAAAPGDAANIIRRLVPVFTSRRFGDPGYAQLATSCPQEIRLGAADQAEMGVFQYLAQPQREANLRESLREYLRFGLEAGIFSVT